MKTRLIEVINYSGLSVRAFALSCGMNRPTLYRMLKGINAVNLNCIVSVLEHFPEISAEWMMRGQGSMLLDNSKEVERMTKLMDAITTLQDAINAKNDTIKLLEERLKLLENSKQ